MSEWTSLSGWEFQVIFLESYKVHGDSVQHWYMPSHFPMGLKALYLYTIV